MTSRKGGAALKKWFFVITLLAMSVFIAQLAIADKAASGAAQNGPSDQTGTIAHKDYADMKIADCNDCHKNEGIAPTHEGDWLHAHAILAKDGQKNCAACHEQSFCLDCHKGGGINADLSTNNYRADYTPKSHRSDWLEIHPIKAKDNPQKCYRCHEQQYCNQCHNRFPKGSMAIKSHLMLGPGHQTYAPALSEHATEARRNLQSCQACHPDGDVCIQCHSAKSGGVSPHPRSWGSISGNYRNNGMCEKCHLPGTY
jgi:hypothetical protein